MDGRITYWNQKRGFGFVKRDTGGVAFVHIRCVVDDSVDALPIGTRIAFDERPPKGAEDKPMAVNVSVVTRAPN
jgi:cold shock CspA family protein